MNKTNQVTFTDQQIKALDLRIKLVPDRIKLVEQIRIGRSHPLYDECHRVCHLSKNLYNFALFEVKAQYRENLTTLSYNTLAKTIKQTPDFQALPAKVSQQTLRLLQQNINSFIGSRKSAKVTHNVRFPRYYPSNKIKDDGLCVATFTSQAILRNVFNTNKNEQGVGCIQLSNTKIAFYANKIKTFEDIRQVRIVPHAKQFEKNGYFTLEIIYERTLDKKKMGYRERFDYQVEKKVLAYKTDDAGDFITDKNGEKIPLKTQKKETLSFDRASFREFASLDINLNQLALFEGKTSSSYLFNIKRLKAINWFYNKTKAKIQSQIDTNQNKLNALNQQAGDESQETKESQAIKEAKEALKISIKKLKNKLKKLTTKRNGKMHYQSHLISKLISEKLDHLHVNTLIIGKNKDMKKGINLGKVTNQNFVFIPFNQILDKLVYKAHLKGIDVFFVEESYTSKTSFLDRETLYNAQGRKENKPAKGYQFLGKREKRGLFRTKDNNQINADINGALNIARKVIDDAIYQWVDIYRVGSSYPRKIKV